MITLRGNITAKNYVDIFADQVYAMVQFLFPNGDGVLLDEKVIVHTAHIVQDWVSEHKYFTTITRPQYI